jgi:Protein of unknown function (DUF4199)
MNRIILKYILIAIVITVVWTLLEHVLGYNTNKHETGQYARLVPTFIYWGCVIMAIIEVKRRSADTFRFRQAMNTGVGVSLGFSLLVSAWYALYAEVINKDYQPSLLAFEKNKLLAAHASPERIAEKLKEVEMQSGGSVASYVILFAFMALFGIGISLITAAIVKRRVLRQG